MKLRLKVLIILASLWAVVTLTIYAYSRFTLTNEYLRLEQKTVASDIEQTRNTLQSMMSSIQLINKDWSEWDEAYQFMKDKNPDFIKANLAANAFQNTKVNFMLFFTPAGKLFFGLNYDFNKDKFVAVPPDLLTYLEARQAISGNHLQSGKVGILNTSSGYVVLSSSSIVTGKGEGPPRGTLVMGYFFNDREIERLSRIVNVQVAVLPIPLSTDNPIVKTAFNHLEKGNPYYIAPANRYRILGFAMIYDIDNNPVGVLRIVLSRALYNQGMNTIDQYLAIVLMIGIIFIITMWYLLKYFVLDRIIRVSNQVNDIKSGNKFSDRLRLQGHDELGTMVASINGLMEIIELTQEQLKHRILLRTEELERLSILNKNLYTEMVQQKEIETQLREGEKVLRHMAYYDALTGLPNRIYFHELLQSKIIKAERTGASFVIFFLDADKFKSINDTYGHYIGDKYLQHVAGQLRIAIKDIDIAARLAGDEFILVFDEVGINKAVINQIVEKILSHISIPLHLKDLTIDSTFSIGICIYPYDGRTLEELEKHADLAMYEAKKQSGTACCYYQDITHHVTIHD